MAPVGAFSGLLLRRAAVTAGTTVAVGLLGMGVLTGCDAIGESASASDSTGLSGLIPAGTRALVDPTAGPGPGTVGDPGPGDRDNDDGPGGPYGLGGRAGHAAAAGAMSTTSTTSTTGTPATTTPSPAPGAPGPAQEPDLGAGLGDGSDTDVEGRSFGTDAGAGAGFGGTAGSVRPEVSPPPAATATATSGPEPGQHSAPGAGRSVAYCGSIEHHQMGTTFYTDGTVGWSVRCLNHMLAAHGSDERIRAGF